MSPSPFENDTSADQIASDDLTITEERIKLPGFGLDLTHFPRSPLDRDGNRLRFPHVIADDWTSGGVTVRERRMLGFINDITDKPGWEREVFDQAITAQWRAEACVWREDLNDVFLSSAMFDYVSAVCARAQHL